MLSTQLPGEEKHGRLHKPLAMTIQSNNISAGVLLFGSTLLPLLLHFMSTGHQSPAPQHPRHRHEVSNLFKPVTIVDEGGEPQPPPHGKIWFLSISCNSKTFSFFGNFYHYYYYGQPCFFLLPKMFFLYFCIFFQFLAVLGHFKHFSESV